MGLEFWSCSILFLTWRSISKQQLIFSQLLATHEIMRKDQSFLGEKTGHFEGLVWRRAGVPSEARLGRVLLGVLALLLG
jgi:hypothetical protein